MEKGTRKKKTVIKYFLYKKLTILFWTYCEQIQIPDDAKRHGGRPMLIRCKEN